MTTSPRWIVRRSQDLPHDAKLRKAAEGAQAAGEKWSVLVTVPPPVLGRAVSREAHPTEILVVGQRAARVRLGRVEWGRWDEEREVAHFRGAVVDLTGRSSGGS